MVEFFKDFIAESKRIVWPNRKDLIEKTANVILFSVAVGAIIFLMDTVFNLVITLLSKLPM